MSWVGAWGAAIERRVRRAWCEQPYLGVGQDLADTLLIWPEVLVRGDGAERGELGHAPHLLDHATEPLDAGPFDFGDLEKKEKKK